MAQGKLYLPETATHYRDARQHVTYQLADEFGGCTVYEGARGNWVANNGELLREDVTVIEAVSNDEAALRSLFRDLARAVKAKTAESVVLAEAAGETITIE